jgi:hypothetical protein
VADVAVLIPTLGRVHHIEPLLESLYTTTDNARPVFIAGRDDLDVINKVRSLGEQCITVKPREKGEYAHKINIGYTYSEEPILFLGATDLKFHLNWLDNAMSRLSDIVHVVGTNDLGNAKVLRGQHSTHSLVTREYVEKYGTIDQKGAVLCRKYWHEFVDDEFVETAKYRGMWDMAMDSIVEHLHPAFDKGKWDDSYAQVKDRYYVGRDMYEARKHLWTPQ